MDRKLSDETYKFALAFIDWKDQSESPKPQMDEVSMSWRRLMIQEDIVRKMLGGDEPCEGCPDEDT